METIPLTRTTLHTVQQSKLFLLSDGKITLYLYQCLPTVDIVWA